MQRDKSEDEVRRTMELFPCGKVAQAYRMGRRDANLELAGAIDAATAGMEQAEKLFKLKEVREESIE